MQTDDVVVGFSVDEYSVGCVGCRVSMEIQTYRIACNLIVRRVEKSDPIVIVPSDPVLFESIIDVVRVGADDVANRVPFDQNSIRSVTDRDITGAIQADVVSLDRIVFRIRDANSALKMPRDDIAFRNRVVDES